MSGLKLAIWDVDGTLVDSRESIHEIMVETFRMSALTPPEYDATRRIVGLSLHEACGQSEQHYKDQRRDMKSPFHY